MKHPRSALTALALSASALVGIAVHEGFSPVAYFATKHEQQQGISTIGFGTTEGVKPGDTITVQTALVRKMQDINKFEGAVRKCVTVPLHQHEYDAFLSLAYNIGSGAFCRSTLVRLLNQGDYEGACRQILRWDKQAGQTLRGLTIRRQAEFKQCMGEK